jgi:hypothetical protein
MKSFKVTMFALLISMAWTNFAKAGGMGVYGMGGFPSSNFQEFDCTKKKEGRIISASLIPEDGSPLANLDNKYNDGKMIKALKERYCTRVAFNAYGAESANFYRFMIANEIAKMKNSKRGFTIENKLSPVMNLKDTTLCKPLFSDTTETSKIQPTHSSSVAAVQAVLAKLTKEDAKKIKEALEGCNSSNSPSLFTDTKPDFKNVKSTHSTVAASR